LSLGAGTLDIGPALRAAARNTAIQTRIPLRCFTGGGAHLDAVDKPLRIDAPAGLTLSLRGAQIEGTGATIPCP
ncbi:putative glycoside hydrolase, partial [Salmonella enterica]|uniref:putative glycoside hydrolase n=1 Tax=Salmonella enterica TaxID=28901 RepID=UPI003D26D331